MTPVRSLLPCRAVLFDAVGTLIHPEPSAGAVYAAAGQRFGSRLGPATIAARFRTAFHRQEDLDRGAGLRTDEARELTRWRTIVAEVLDDVADREACFAYLYEHFARPAMWRVTAGSGEMLAQLAGRGFVLGVASNFDHRLHAVLDGHTSLRPLTLVLVSSEVGWRKPARAFFAAACERLALAPHEVLIVGDDRDNDFDGARSAGLPALLYDPEADATDGSSIRRLDELLLRLTFSADAAARP